MDKNSASIKVYGLDSDISLVTEALKIEPTKFWSAGDKKKNGSIHEVSLWQFESKEFTQEYMDDSIEKIIDFIQVKKLDFSLIPHGFTPFISCAGWHKEHSPSFHISAKTIHKLSEIGLAIDFDLYCENEQNG